MNKIFCSDNLGQKFFEINIPAYVYGKNVLGVNSIDNLFFSSGDGIYRSSDPYINWTKIYTGINYCVLIDSNDIVYTGIEDGVL